MKDRKDWGPADHVAEGQIIAGAIFFGGFILFFGWRLIASLFH